MNNLFQGLVVTVLSLVLAIIIGKIFVLDPVNTEIAQFQQQEKNHLAELTLLNTQINQLKAIAAGSKNLTVATRLLKPGDEQQILRLFLDTASATAVAIHGLKLLAPVKVKPAESSEANTAAASLPTIDPTKLDANGMPIGLTDSEESQDFFMEIQPVRLTLKARFTSWGRFLSAIHKQLPLYGVRQLSFALESSGFAKGSLELLLPVSKGAARGTGATPGEP